MNVSMNDFITELSAWAARHNLKQEVLPDFYDRSTMTQFTKAGEVYNKVVDFLNDSNLYGRKNWNNNFCIGASETLNTIPSSDHQINITADSLYALAKECGTPEDQMQTTLSLITGRLVTTLCLPLQCSLVWRLSILSLL